MSINYFKNYLLFLKSKKNKRVILAGFFVLCIASFILFLSIFSKHLIFAASTVSDTYSQTLKALGWHLLTGDEFAIFRQQSGSPSGENVTESIRLNNGQIYTFAVDKNTKISFIEGDSGTNKYIKNSNNVEIHNINELDNANNVTKIDPAVTQKLKNKGATAKVIIQLNLSFNKFYEPKDSTNTDVIKARNGEFENAKSRALGHFSNKSKFKSELKVINGFAAEIDQNSLQSLAQSNDVKKIELDQQVKTFLDTSVDQIQAKDIWSLEDTKGNSLTGKGIRIGIIDTGVDYNHPDLGGCLGSGCKVIGGYDFVNNDADPMDDMGHGTHVAGITAGTGLLNGVAPDASIVAIKVLDASGIGYASQIVAGINYATDPNGDGNTSDHVDVATMSLGGSGNPDDAMSTAVDNSIAAGVTYTIAAGNSGGSSTIASPGTARNAITVAASCKTAQIGSNLYCPNAIASFSSRGPLIWNGLDLQKPDIAAPGVLICSARWGISFDFAPTCFDDHHIRISGTSMATPHVAGAVALVRQLHPDYSPAQIKQLLKSTARNLGMTYNDQGAGEVNVKTAIGLSPKAIATPSAWTVASDPTKKLSSNTQIFSVTATDVSIATLSANFEGSINGITLSLSKSVLNVGNKGTDSFNATINTDNDIAKAGTYFVRINLTNNGVVIGNIPIFLTVQPTITAVPNSSIDYGYDDPSLPNWTSSTQSITVKNLRTDISQSLGISSSGYPTGIVSQDPTQVTIPASGSATINTSLAVDNTQLGNNIYRGLLTISNSTNSLKLSTKLVKFYVLIIQDNNTAEFSKAWVIVHDRTLTNYSDRSGDDPRVFYFNNPGTYDAVVIYQYFYDSRTNLNNVDFTVIKEGIVVSSGLTTVNVSRSEAKNQVQSILTDPNGAKGSFYQKTELITYLPNPRPFQVGLLSTISGGNDDNIMVDYFNNVSSNYNYTRKYEPLQPASTLVYYYGAFTGLQADKVFTNTASDFKIMNVKWDVDQQTGSAKPVIMNGRNFVFNTNLLTIPINQTIYSLIPETSDKLLDKFIGVLTDFAQGFFSGDTTPQFSTVDNPHRWTASNNLLPNFQDRTVYAGLGPSVWFGKFKNQSVAPGVTVPQIVLFSYYDEIGNTFDYNNPGPGPLFLRQDYTTKQYSSIPFSLYANGVLLPTGTIPAFPIGGFPTTYSADQPGTYEFVTSLTYKNKGLDMIGKVDATFFPYLSDPNPPSIKRLYFLSDNKRSEQYVPTVVNRVEFELDPIGGSLSQVQVSFATDGINFNPLTVTNVNGVYTSNISSIAGIQKITIKLSATDNSNNQLIYSFEVPVGSPPLDKQAPTVAITAPINGASVGGKVNVTATASDNIGVTKVELYVDNTLLPKDTSSPYSFSWDTTKFTLGSHQLLAKAYDAAGNIGTSSILVTIIDLTPPTVSISSPLNGSNVSVNTTITISAKAADNIGIKKVEFYVNNVLTCTDTTTNYTCSWKVPSKTGVSYTLLAKAYDAAGNITQSKAITIKSGK